MDNGLLIDAIQDEEDVIKKGVEAILLLDENPLLVKRLSQAARAFALANFSSVAFDEAYRKLFART
jgi:hypothetical protein